MAALEQTVTIINNSGKIISTVRTTTLQCNARMAKGHPPLRDNTLSSPNRER